MQPAGPACDAIRRSVESARPDILVTNEMPFGPWLAEHASFDADAAQRSIALHEQALDALSKLGAAAVISSRPVAFDGRLANEAFVLESNAYARSITSRTICYRNRANTYAPPLGHAPVVAETANIFRRNYRLKPAIGGLDLFSSEAHADTGTQSHRLPKSKTNSGGFIMTKSAKLPKLFLPALLIASALAAPSFAFAQDNNAPVTRAEVRAQLTQLEKAGYSPATNDNYYPQALQEAQQRVDASNGVESQAYGPSTSGTSASGLHVPVAPASGDDQHSIYFGH